jgi:hypothetical protein
MPVVNELLPPWMRFTEEQEHKRRRALERFNLLAEEAPEILRSGRAKIMEKFDALPREVRLLVHEYGKIASNLYEAGTPPHLIESHILAKRRERDFATLELEL